mgnify:CR=1 FL=1
MDIKKAHKGLIDSKGRRKYFRELNPVLLDDPFHLDKSKITKKGRYGIQIWISKVIDLCGRNFVPICVKKFDVVIIVSKERLLIMVT